MKNTDIEKAVILEQAQAMMEEEDNDVLKSLGLQIQKKCSYFSLETVGSGTNPTIWRKNCQNRIVEDKTYCTEHESVNLI